MSTHPRSPSSSPERLIIGRRTFLRLAALAAAAPPVVPRLLAATDEPARFDVIVYSAVPAGIASAIAAAREGARVLLIEPLRHVGGLSTSGINTAESEHMLKWTIGGFALEFYRRLGDYYGTHQPEYFFESSVAEKVYLALLRESGVTLRFGSSVERVAKRGATIERITLTDGSVHSARVFIDASYEGDLMARACVSYAIGRDARQEFQEEAAGIRFDPIPERVRTVDANGKLLPGISGWVKDYREGDAHRGVMNYNFRLTVARDPRYQVPIPAPSQYDPQRYAILGEWLGLASARGQQPKLSSVLSFLARRNGKFELNNRQDAIFSLGYLGGQFDWPDGSYRRRRQIYDDHLDYTLGLLRFLAHDPAVPAEIRGEMRGIGLHRDEFVDNGHLPYQLYVREARRMRGPFIVTQRDVTVDRRKADSIGISSHFIDSHHVQRLAVSESAFVNEGRIWRIGQAWQMPYRMLTPRAAESENLLVVGAASLSHVAFCTYRLESVWMIAGHAGGVAGAMAAKANVPVQQVDVSALQGKLRGQGQILDFIPGLPEKDLYLNGPAEW